MKIRNLFILPALVLVVSLALANAVYAKDATGCDCASTAGQHKCCCEKCDCQNWSCQCDANCCCEKCQCHSKLKWIFKHKTPCKCCKDCDKPRETELKEI